MLECSLAYVFYHLCVVYELEVKLVHDNDLNFRGLLVPARYLFAFVFPTPLGFTWGSMGCRQIPASSKVLLPCLIAVHDD